MAKSVSKVHLSFWRSHYVQILVVSLAMQTAWSETAFAKSCQELIPRVILTDFAATCEDSKNEMAIKAKKECGLNKLPDMVDLEGGVLDLNFNVGKGANIKVGFNLDVAIEPIPGSDNNFLRTDVYHPTTELGLIDDAFKLSLAAWGKVIHTRSFDSVCSALDHRSFLNPLNLKPDFNFLKNMQEGEYFRFEVPTLGLKIGDILQASIKFVTDLFMPIKLDYGYRWSGGPRIHFYKPDAKSAAERKLQDGEIWMVVMSNVEKTMPFGLTTGFDITGDFEVGGIDLFGWIKDLFAFNKLLGVGTQKVDQNVTMEDMVIDVNGPNAQQDVDEFLTHFLDSNFSYFKKLADSLNFSENKKDVKGQSINALAFDSNLLNGFVAKFNSKKSDTGAALKASDAYHQVKGERRENRYNLGTQLIHDFSLVDQCGYYDVGLSDRSKFIDSKLSVPFCDFYLRSKWFFGINSRRQRNRMMIPMKNINVNLETQGIVFEQSIYDKSLTLKEHSILSNRLMAYFPYLHHGMTPLLRDDMTPQQIKIAKPNLVVMNSFEYRSYVQISKFALANLIENENYNPGYLYNKSLEFVMLLSNKENNFVARKGRTIQTRSIWADLVRSSSLLNAFLKPVRALLGMPQIKEMTEPKTQREKELVAYELSEMVKKIAVSSLRNSNAITKDQRVDAYREIERNRYFRAVGIGLMYHLTLANCSYGRIEGEELDRPLCRDQGFAEVVISGKRSDGQIYRSGVSIGQKDPEITGPLGMLTWLTEVQRFNGRLTLPPDNLEFNSLPTAKYKMVEVTEEPLTALHEGFEVQTLGDVPREESGESL